MKNTPYEVPQESILGSLLFLIYTNDLPTVTQLFYIMMYANDTTLYCNYIHGFSETELKNENNNCIMVSIKLSLNVSNTIFL